LSALIDSALIDADRSPIGNGCQLGPWSAL